MTISTKDALLNPGCAGQWKRDIFWRGKMYRFLLHFLIYSGNFFSCCSLFFFKMRGNKRGLVFMVQFTLLYFNFFLNFLCLHIQSSRSDFFIKHKQTMFLSRVSRVICVWAQKVLVCAGVSSSSLQWLRLTCAALTGWGWQQSQPQPSKHSFVAKCASAFSEISGVTFNKRGNRRSSPLIHWTIKPLISDLCHYCLSEPG